MKESYLERRSRIRHRRVMGVSRGAKRLPRMCCASPDGPRTGARRSAIWLAGLLVASAARTETAPDVESARLPDVWVVASTPVPGADVERRQVAATTLVLDREDIERLGIPDLTGAIARGVAAVTVNDVEGNPFQPDILYRGFTASPVAGTPQGIAVYVDGARFNDGFGDTVNWDVIPPVAIDRVDVQASNPVFGLNALGGSIAIRLKDGFSPAQSTATVYGGSFGRAAGIAEVAHSNATAGLYAAADVTHDDGHQRTGASSLERVYVDGGWRDESNEAHASLSAAHDVLGNPGATPVQALGADPRAIFTAPNSVDDTYYALRLRGTHRLEEARAAQAVAYFQTLNQRVPNGITADVAPCADGSGLLCNGDGTPVTGRGGVPVADFLHGGPYSGLSTQQLGTHGYGVSAQISDAAPLLGRDQRLVVGASLDGSYSTFAGVQSLGGFDPGTRQFLGPGVVLDEPGAGVNPVRVRAVTHFYGVFAREVLTPTPRLDVDLAARFNEAKVALEDRLGGPVDGRHAYGRVNPSVGLVFRAGGLLALHLDYAETNRAPTPQELSCAGPATPCSLLNFFVGDPDLRQVVARSLEAGLHRDPDPGATLGVGWRVAAYRTQTANDILYESTLADPNLAYYTNAGRTRRLGAEAEAAVRRPTWRVTAAYAYTRATYQTALEINSPDNPAADANGRIAVRPGARIPGIALHRGTLGLDADVGSRGHLAVAYSVQSGAYRFGDEANLTAPLGGYGVLDLHASLRVGARCTVFATLENALDRRFYTYGAFGPVEAVPWPAVPGGVQDPRTASPGRPRALYGGLRLAF